MLRRDWILAGYLGLCSLPASLVLDSKCPVQVPECKRPVLGCKCPRDQKQLWVQVCVCLPRQVPLLLALVQQHLRRSQTRCPKFPARSLPSSPIPKHWRI